MPSSDALKEAGRVMTICNACRYCEGFCAVYPAMELRRTFTGQDLKYLANLCHNCRGCYYACQYAPPHEFALNVPRTLGELRLETYREFSMPRFLAGLFRQNGFKAAMITALCAAAALLLMFVFQDPAVVFARHVGENAFYKVIPYTVMVTLFTVLGFAINKYCYISVRELPPFFEHKHRIVYSYIEMINEVDQIKHPSVRGVLQELGADKGLEIHHDGDLPARTGLGSSSSFTVGLLNCLYALKGKMPTKEQLAKEAINIEQEMCNENGQTI